MDDLDSITTHSNNRTFERFDPEAKEALIIYCSTLGSFIVLTVGCIIVCTRRQKNSTVSRSQNVEHVQAEPLRRVREVKTAVPQMAKERKALLKVTDLKALRDKLQHDIGRQPKVVIEEFVNWATTRKLHNVLAVKPVNLEEIKAVVKAAAKNKLRIRCAGAKHSWSPVFPDEGHILMYIQNIQRHDGPRIELLKNRDGSYKVNVMSGVTVGELMDFELKNGVNLPCNVILTTSTYGGIVVLGCHGVGWDCLGISDYCTQMRIIDAFGELRTFRNQEDPDMMHAVQCNLGLFGIIYDMHLEVLPKKIAQVHDDFSFKGDLFYNAKKLKKLVTTHDSVEIFLFPFNSVDWIDAAEQLTRLIGTKQTLTRDEWDPKKDQLFIRRINFHDPKDVTDKKLIHGCYYKHLNVRTWLEAKGVSVIDDFVINFPKEITPLVSKAAHNYLKQTTAGSRWQPLPNAIHYRPNIELHAVHDMEVAINAKDDFSNVASACQTILELMRQEAENARFPVNLAMEMRWMKYSEAYLCPAIVGNPKEGGSGHTFYVEILSYAHTPGWKEFANRLAKELLKMPGVQFHWAKEWDYVDGVEQHIQKTMAKQIRRFRSALNRSRCDPGGVFLNEKLKKLLFS